MEYIHKRLLFSEIHDNQYCVRNTLYKGVNEISKLTFQIYCPMLVKIGIRFIKKKRVVKRLLVPCKSAEGRLYFSWALSKLHLSGTA